jgi:hypothetical protein
MVIQGTLSWQAVLQKIIVSPKERQRLANELGINTITLTRWAKEDSHPQRSYLARLVKVVHPHQRSELLNALLVAYPDMQDKLMEETTEYVPSPFFRQILKDRASIIEAMRPWQISSAVLDEALRLLDPNQLGMAVTPALCMPPVDNKIRSLREHGGRGTDPWDTDLEHEAIFLGMNCLAGHVVQSGRASSVRDVKRERYIPVFAHPEGMEISSAAAPIWLEGKIAGCLLASSTQLEHFTQTRLDLLLNLANIFALALNPDDFYPHQMVQLRYIPRPPIQEQYLRTFRHLVTSRMIQAGRRGETLNNAEAEKAAWQELEEKLIRVGAELDESEM